MLSIFINILLAFNVIVCVLLILLTLMQRPKNEGLGAAFGGGMTDNLFGAQTTNVLAKATRVLGFTFLAVSLILTILYARLASSPSSVQARLAAKPIPAAPAKDAQSNPANADDAGKAATDAKLKEAAAKATPASATPAATAAPTVAPTVAPAPSATPEAVATPAPAAAMEAATPAPSATPMETK